VVILHDLYSSLRGSLGEPSVRSVSGLLFSITVFSNRAPISTALSEFRGLRIFHISIDPKERYGSWKPLVSPMRGICTRKHSTGASPLNVLHDSHSQFLPVQLSLVVLIAVPLAVVVLVLEEEVLVRAVAGEGDGGCAQAGKAALESVPAREGARVSPGLAVFERN
jgi:hypothetical protein